MTIDKKVYEEDKIFSHIHNDFAMLGELEGNYTINFCKFLINLEESFKTNTKAHETFLSIYDLLYGIIKHEQSQTEILKSLAQSKNNSSSVVFVSGWMGNEEHYGHTIIPKLQYTDNQDLLLFLYNTGTGIQNFHAYQFGWKGLLYATAKIYKIPKQSLEEGDNITLLLDALLKPSIEPIVKPPYLDIEPSDMFYSNLNAMMIKLDAEELDPTYHKISFSVGNRSGTCSWKSLMALLKNSIPKYEDYLLLKFEIKMNSLIKYFDEQSNKKRLTVPFVQQQINYASENLSRLVIKIDKLNLPVLEPQRRKECLERIAIIKKIVTSNMCNISESISLQALSCSSIKKMTIPSFYMPDIYSQNKAAADHHIIINDSKNESFKQINTIDLSKLIDLERVKTIALDNTIPPLTRLLALENFINSIDLDLNNSIWIDLAQNKVVTGGQLADLAQIHAYLHASELGAQYVSYDSALSITTINFLILGLFEPNLKLLSTNSDKIVAFIRSLYTDILTMAERKIIASNPELIQRNNYIVNFSRELKKKYESKDIFSARRSFKNNDDTCTLQDFIEAANLCNIMMQRSDIQNMYLVLQHGHVLLKMFSDCCLSDALPSYFVRTTSVDNKNNIRSCVSKHDMLGTESNSRSLTFNFEDLYLSGVSTAIQNNLNYTITPNMISLYQYNYRIQYNKNNDSKEKVENFLSSTIQANNGSSDVVFAKDIASLWLAEDSCIAFIYDLIYRYPSKLENNFMQDAIFLNLFSGEIIDKQIQHSSKGIEQLIDLLVKNIKIALNDNDIGASLLFFLKLNVYLEQYLIKLHAHGNNNVTETMLNKLDENNVEINSLLDKSPKNMELRILQVKILSNKIEKTNNICNQDLVDLFLCNVLFNSSYRIVNNKNTVPFLAKSIALDLLTKQQNKIISKLNNTNDKLEIITKVLMKLMDNNNLQLGEIQGEYPNFNFIVHPDQKTYDLDFMTGKLSSNTGMYCTVPPFILQTKTYKKFFGDQVFAGELSADQKTFIFNDKLGASYKLYKTNDDVDLARYFDKKLYKYLDKYDMLTVHKFINLLPATMLDSAHQMWVEIHNDKTAVSENIITDTTGKQIKYTIIGGDKITDNHERQLLDLNSFSDNNLIQQLQKIENKIFIEIWQNFNDTQSFCIKLPRYNIEFVSSDEGKTFVWLNDIRYKISMQPPVYLIENFENYLVLDPVEANTNLSQIVLIPKQDCILSDHTNITIDNKNIKLDINNEINLRKHIKSYLYENKYFSSDFNSEQEIEKWRTTFATFNYNNTESFSILELNHNVLSTQFPAELFHLAYIYLAKNKTDISLSLLNKGLVSYTGIKSELLWLSRIVAKQPSFIPLTMKEKKIYTSLSIAEHIAIKAFAAYVLASKPDMIDSLRIDEKKNLIDDCVSNITLYYNTLNNIPNNMRLDKLQELIVLQAFKFISTIPLLWSLEKEFARSLQAPSEPSTEITHETKTAYQSEINSAFVNVGSFRTIIALAMPQVESLRGIYSLNMRLDVRSQLKYKDINKNNINKYDYKNIIDDLDGALKILLTTAGDTNRDFLVKHIHRTTCIFYSSVGNIYVKRQQLPMIEAQRIQQLLVILFAISNCDQFINKKILDIYNFYEPKFSDKYGDTEKNYKFLEEIVNVLKDKKINLQINKAPDCVMLELPPYNTHQQTLIKPILKVTKEQDIELTSDCMQEFLLKTDLFQETNAESTKNNNVTQTSADASGYKERLKQVFEDDCLVGEHLNKLAENRSTTIYNELKDKIPIILKKQEELLSNINTSIESLTDLKKAIIALANKLPSEDADQLNAQLALNARNRHSLDLPEILGIFLHAQPEQYMQHTFLNDHDIPLLHNKIFNYLIKATHTQHLQRISAVVTKLSGELSEAQKKSLIITLGSLLSSGPAYDQEKNIAMLLFEYLDNKLIRPDQVKYLEILLNKKSGNYENILCQMTMGGGKSKLLLPMLAKQKAIRGRLSMVIVSRDMYQTNLVDLRNLSKKIFNQNVHEIIFNRNTSLDNDYFKKMYHQLLGVMTHGHYVITTPESVQSLNLKYLELLEFSSEETTVARQYLEKILTIFKQQTDVVIDEVDQNLQTKKELNFSIGLKESIKSKYPSLIQDSMDLYDLLIQSCQIDDYVNGKKILHTETDKLNLSKACVNALFPGFLQNMGINAISTLDEQQLREYLSDKASDIPDCLQGDKKSLIRDRIAVLRENCTSLLVKTLSKHKNEHYGLPKVSSDLIKSNIGVPYIGANTPSANSEFASILEQINYTIQSHMGETVSNNVFLMILKSFKNRYKQALENHLSDANMIQKEFSDLLELSNIYLHKLSLQDNKTVAELYEKIKNHEKIKKYALIEFILPGITTNSIQEKSNSQNLIRLFNSVQGFTGTPYNYRTLTTFFEYKEYLSAGSDGKTINSIIKNTKQVYKLEDKQNVFDILREYFHDTLRAFIDQGALCKEINNYEVARSIAEICKTTSKTKKTKKTKYILYFNELNQLAAFPVDPGREVIVIGSSDPDVIFDNIHARPDEYFTYYDQRHATGIDIKQEYNAEALVSISETTILRDLLQASMRMRGLSEEQKLNFVLPMHLPENIKNVKSIIYFTFDNQTEQLADDHYAATKQKILAIITTDFEKRLIAATETEKVRYMQQFSRLFFIKNDTSLFSQYGEKISQIPIRKELEQFMETYFDVWDAALKKLSISNDVETKKMRQQLTDIVNSSIDFCKPTVESFKNAMVGEEQEQQIQQEAEQEQQKELQQETQQENNLGALVPSTRQSLKNAFDALIHLRSESIDQYKAEHIMKDFIDLNTILKHQDNKHDQWFADNIFISPNLQRVYNSQEKSLDCKQEVYNIMVLYDPEIEEAVYVLLTVEDSKELIECCEYLENKLTDLHVTICSMRGFTLFDSNTNIVSMPKDYDLAMQQIQFYNGDSGALIKHQTWLLQGATEEKMNFLEENVRRNHGAKQDELQSLQMIVATKLKTAKLPIETSPPSIADLINDQTDLVYANISQQGLVSESLDVGLNTSSFPNKLKYWKTITPLMHAIHNNTKEKNDMLDQMQNKLEIIQKIYDICEIVQSIKSKTNTADDNKKYSAYQSELRKNELAKEYFLPPGFRALNIIQLPQIAVQNRNIVYCYIKKIEDLGHNNVKDAEKISTLKNFLNNIDVRRNRINPTKSNNLGR